jgi:hypothetical protein
MTGHLSEAITALLAGELPSLFGGATPAVKSSVAPDIFVIDPSSLDAQASEPREDDRTDNLTFNAAQPQGPYTLAQSPSPGPIRIWLTTAAGDRLALNSPEILFDPVNPQKFTLHLNAQRDLTGVNGVRVLYSVVAVYANLKYTQDLALVLENKDPVVLSNAEDMAIAVLALNHPKLVTNGAANLQVANYGAQIEVKTLQMFQGDAPTAGSRRILFHAEMEIKVTRALAPTEGKPITRIRTVPGVGDPKRPVDIRVDVEA